MKLPYIGERSVQFGRRITRNVLECFGFIEVKTIFTTRSLRVNPIKDVLPTFSRSNVIYKFECHCGSEYVGRTGQSLIARIKQHVPAAIRSSKHAVAISSKSSAPIAQLPSVRRSDRIKARAVSNDTIVPPRRSARILARSSAQNPSLNPLGVAGGKAGGVIVADSSTHKTSGDEEQALEALSSDKTKSSDEIKSSSAIGQHLINNSECAKNYDDSRFSILAFARNFSQLKTLEAIFITSRKPILCKQKNFVAPLRVFDRF